MDLETVKIAIEKNKDISEITKNRIENTKSFGNVVEMKLNDIMSLTPEQLADRLEGNINNRVLESPAESHEVTKEVRGLSEDEKLKIKEETNWSKEIVDNMSSMKECEIYHKEAGLNEIELAGEKCLIRSDIDWDRKDVMGRTNSERAKQGLSPLNNEGKVIELHHIGQHKDSPLAELTTEEHRGKGNDATLHDKTKETEIDRKTFATERSEHWMNRANEGDSL